MVKQGIPELLLSAWLHLLQFEYWLLKQYEEYNTKMELNWTKTEVLKAILSLCNKSRDKLFIDYKKIHYKLFY